MKEGILTRYMELGFPRLRQTSGLPDWLVPDVAEMARNLGDEAILEIGRSLGLTETFSTLLEQAPDPDNLPAEIWQENISRWPAIHQALPVTMALLRACEKIDALERRDALIIDFASLVRSLATIHFAPFVPNGSEILTKLATILDGNPAEPAELLSLYFKSLENGDRDALVRVEECILKNPAWAQWSERLLATGKSCKFTPRVIGVSPEPTEGLIQLLAAMIVEVTNADYRRDTRN